jgi:hypothetical protein
MEKKFRYEPPVLVDMMGPDLCGDFATCNPTGTNKAYGSCKYNVDCNTGQGAEHCKNGSYACGCDSCCGTGTSYTSYGGLPWVSGCTCAGGGQAYSSCNDGQVNCLTCKNGGSAGPTCNTGTNIYGGFYNCISSGA